MKLDSRFHGNDAENQTGVSIKKLGTLDILEKIVEARYSRDKSATLYAADIIALEPMRRFRIDAQDFNYACLKDRKGYNAFNNFRLLISDLALKSPSCQRNAGIKVLVDARPIHEMAYDSMDAYEREIRWLLTIKSLSRERNTK